MDFLCDRNVREHAPPPPSEDDARGRGERIVESLLVTGLLVAFSKPGGGAHALARGVLVAFAVAAGVKYAMEIAYRRRRDDAYAMVITVVAVLAIWVIATMQDNFESTFYGGFCVMWALDLVRPICTYVLVAFRMATEIYHGRRGFETRPAPPPTAAPHEKTQ